MSQCADNFRFDVTAWEGHHDFDMLGLCLKLAFANHNYATHFSMWAKPPRVILHWAGEGKDLFRLPSPIGWEAVAVIVKAWLQKQDYANEPDHDGDNSKGWRIYNGPWGHIDEYRYAICAIEPAWLMHGK